jgi:hypothetical protein
MKLKITVVAGKLKRTFTTVEAARKFCARRSDERSAGRQGDLTEATARSPRAPIARPRKPASFSLAEIR